MHGVGATLYYDGANLNAVMGLSRPGDMGFDIVHFNLHKSFTQPHGGGGPGSGPIAVSERIAPFLPAPGRRPRAAARRRRPRTAFDLDYERPEVDRPPARLPRQLRLLRALLRLHLLARRRRPQGRLRDGRAQRQLPARAAARAAASPSYLPLAYGELCMHEFVLSGGPMKRELEIKTLDLAKRLLDFGFHPPTVYFPLLVDEALMVEPTETETKETLDAFADAIAAILEEAAEDPEIARSAPYTHARAAPRRGRRGEAPGHPRGPRLGRAMAIEHRKLGSTGVRVSPLCLGAMMFGAWGNTDHEDSIAIIHRALDAGHQLHRHRRRVLARGVRGDRRQGARRRAARLGRARHQGPRHDDDDDPNQFGNSRRWIVQEVENSLRRLKTDWIDLYQIHRPEPDTDIDETLGALSDLVRAGKVRYIGSSTFPAASDRRGAVGRRAARPRALRVRAAALLDADPARRGRRAAGLRAVRDGRDPVEPARRRLAVGQVRQGRRVARRQPARADAPVAL